MTNELKMLSVVCSSEKAKGKKIIWLNERTANALYWYECTLNNKEFNYDEAKKKKELEFNGMKIKINSQLKDWSYNVE